MSKRKDKKKNKAWIESKTSGPVFYMNPKEAGKLYREHIEEAITEYFEILRNLSDEEVNIQNERRSDADRTSIRCYCGKGWAHCDCQPPTSEQDTQDAPTEDPRHPPVASNTEGDTLV